MVCESKPEVQQMTRVRHVRTPMRRFLRTETASAALLLLASLVAPAWANASPSSYEPVGAAGTANTGRIAPR